MKAIEILVREKRFDAWRRLEEAKRIIAEYQLTLTSEGEIDPSTFEINKGYCEELQKAWKTIDLLMWRSER